MTSLRKEDHSLYENQLLNNTVSISPKDLNVIDINNVILKRLTHKLKNKCISNGIVNTDTIQIVSRSLGQLFNHDLSGYTHFNIKFTADVCSPKEGQIINCIVEEHTDTQTICYIGNEKSSPLEIYLSKQNYINNKEYAGLKKGDRIIVRIIACNFEIGRDKIDTIGEFLEKL